MRGAAIVLTLVLPVAAWGHGDLHEQIDAVSRDLLASPRDGTLYLRRAELRRAHEEWAAALLDYGEAEELGADRNAIQLGRAKALHAFRRSREARGELDRLLEHLPKHVEALATRARVRVALGDQIGAAEDFSRAIEASGAPEPEYYLERANALRAAEPPQLDEALRGLEEGLTRLGPLVTLTLAALDLEMQRGAFDAALQRIDDVLVRVKRREQWLFRRADVLQKAGRHAEALTACQLALDAIDALPARLRNLPATVTLESQVKGLRMTPERPREKEARAGRKEPGSPAR